MLAVYRTTPCYGAVLNVERESPRKSTKKLGTKGIYPVVPRFHRMFMFVFEIAVRDQTHPVGLGSPPYLVIGFMGPVNHSLNISFWLAPMYFENLRIGGTTECSS